jgi:hypothetical protein
VLAVVLTRLLVECARKSTIDTVSVVGAKYGIELLLGQEVEQSPKFELITGPLVRALPSLSKRTIKAALTERASDANEDPSP